MANTIFVQERRVYVKPLWSRLEVILKLKPPTTVKGCRHFAGMVIFLSMFCLELQKLLKPIYNVTRKGRQMAFEEMKHRLIKPPVLHLPTSTGRFHLHSDTSKFATGSVVYEIQKENPN